MSKLFVLLCYTNGFFVKIMLRLNCINFRQLAYICFTRLNASYGCSDGSLFLLDIAYLCGMIDIDILMLPF